MREVPLQPLPVRSLEPIIGGGRADEVTAALQAARDGLGGRTVWTVNSTATGGGVAEMLVRILAYTSGAGIHSPWLVVEGNDAFFRITKRLHHALHGMPGDGGPLGPDERRHYDQVMATNAPELCRRIQTGDVVALNDPQTLGLAPALRRAGAAVVWRNHIGADHTNDHTERAWDFLRPYLGAVDVGIFSRQTYVPAGVEAPVVIMPPTIDPLSAKNRDLHPEAMGPILDSCGFPPAASAPGVPLVVQVSRWDPLKDPLGIIEAFTRLDLPRLGCHLALVGPDTSEVADDPEGKAVYESCIRRWRALPEAQRHRVHLVSLPMDDAEANAWMVNAIQRRATIVVQKSLAEGFGLTVTEAMWKRKPVLASAVGGIQDQIGHGEHGWLLSDPSDPDEFAGAVDALLGDPAGARRLGEQARQRVQARFLDDRQLCDWAQLYEGLALRRRAA